MTAIKVTAAELALLNTIMNRTRSALIEGAGFNPATPSVAPVVTAELFDATPEAGRGTLLNALGIVQVLEEGIILKSPNGTFYKLTVSNAGAAVFTAI